MMNFFRKHTRVILIVALTAFICGTFLGAGSYFFGPKIDYVAKVNGAKISMRLYRAYYAMYSNSIEMYYKTTDESLSEQDIREVKIRAIQTALVQDEVFYQQAKLYGIVITDEELKTDLQNSVAFQDNGVFNKNKYMTFLASIHMKPREYESLRKKQIAGNRVKMMIDSSIKVWSYELDEIAKQNPQITKTAILQSKINAALNEWCSGVVKNSVIVRNDLIFKL
ncbi:MAG: SurA N-terminal domain-containing protein [Endomicrobium sp.]|uniref:SurA N-terminal domain-containing protein n=1 Tax=Candidatus Endomicrobiellum pyrsonymphae TaxID=1408203 RepID=UPI00358CC815|nr:SurA N-terminal domain-containing protein [Endomicrobium sp.]